MTQFKLGIKIVYISMKKILYALSFIFATSTLRAETVTMAFGEKIPPFCFPETNTGIEIEILQAALSYKGHKMVPKYFPFARIPWAFKSKTVDAAMTDLGEDMTTSGAFYGDPAVIYDNVFITLKEKSIIIRKPEDLKGLKVIAFHGALNRYKEWLGPVDIAGLLRNENNQEVQVLSLYDGRHDVVLSDRNIFKYFSSKLKREKNIPLKPIVEHNFVKLNLQDYRPIFRSQKVRDDFNIGLKYIKSTGKFKAIYDKYLKD